MSQSIADSPNCIPKGAGVIASPSVSYGTRSGTLRSKWCAGHNGCQGRSNPTGNSLHSRADEGKNKPRPKCFEDSLALHRVREGVQTRCRCRRSDVSGISYGAVPALEGHRTKQVGSPSQPIKPRRRTSKLSKYQSRAILKNPTWPKVLPLEESQTGTTCRVFRTPSNTGLATISAKFKPLHLPTTTTTTARSAITSSPVSPELAVKRNNLPITCPFCRVLCPVLLEQLQLSKYLIPTLHVGGKRQASNMELLQADVCFMKSDPPALSATGRTKRHIFKSCFSPAAFSAFT